MISQAANWEVPETLSLESWGQFRAKKSLALHEKRDTQRLVTQTLAPHDGLAGKGPEVARRDWQSQREVSGGNRFFFSDSKILVFAFHGHKELNDNLWDGHEGVATREGVGKGEKKNVKGIGYSAAAERPRRFWVGPKEKKKTLNGV